jgi:hypothetical protein
VVCLSGLERAAAGAGGSAAGGRIMVTHGGVSLLFVAFFVLVPMAQSLFPAAGIPRRLNLDFHHVGSARARRRFRMQCRCLSSVPRLSRLLDWALLHPLSCWFRDVVAAARSGRGTRRW